jgi:uncharacterized protein YukE
MVDVRMNYGSMEKMEKEFDAAARQLGESYNEMDKIVKMLEDGALLGVGGDAFREAIQGSLLPVMNSLIMKMNELAGDIYGAVEATRDGVSTAKSRFK